jgi:hypothetical protein
MATIPKRRKRAKLASPAVNLSFDAKTWTRLNEYADIHGCSMSQAVRSLVLIQLEMMLENDTEEFRRGN